MNEPAASLVASSAPRGCFRRDRGEVVQSAFSPTVRSTLSRGAFLRTTDVRTFSSPSIIGLLVALLDSVPSGLSSSLLIVDCLAICEMKTS